MLVGNVRTCKIIVTGEHLARRLVHSLMDQSAWF